MRRVIREVYLGVLKDGLRPEARWIGVCLYVALIRDYEFMGLPMTEVVKTIDIGVAKRNKKVWSGAKWHQLMNNEVRHAAQKEEEKDQSNAEGH
jgi:hypothetical protein